MYQNKNSETDHGRQLRALQRQERQRLAVKMVVDARLAARAAGLPTDPTNQIGEVAVLPIQSAVEVPQAMPAQAPAIEQAIPQPILHKV